MKFVVDMNLSPAWIDVLIEAGHEAVHWSDVGAPSASDEQILAWASEHGHVVVTSDLDFGSILAASAKKQPSVIQLRQGRHDPGTIGSVLVAAIDTARAELATGALLTVDPSRHRLRMLALDRNQENPSE